MDHKESVDFFFRYRPAANSPDGVLLRYLLSFNSTQRKQMILKALRAFYLVAAYGDLGEFQEFSDVQELVALLKQTYGEGAFASLDHSLSLTVNIGVCYSGVSTLADEDDDDNDDDWL
ncbi:hypothetical protein [Anabaena sp. UHCC 0399]|uniref:hypothetical protein n=1 Tax=Anabaena sp. UHCC 0399 TaxID=3110238 RepID=UPI002B1F7BAF|nr:hypothetical protein [Anabaena sp. UHCC 0399]MEA5569128.1 hypothetical protein [Anabaena sp. UHCC 0399]